MLIYGLKSVKFAHKFRIFLKFLTLEGTPVKNIEIKSSLYSRYYAEACNEWRAISVALRLGSTAKKKHRGGGKTLATPCLI